MSRGKCRYRSDTLTVSNHDCVMQHANFVYNLCLTIVRWTDDLKLMNQIQKITGSHPHLTEVFHDTETKWIAYIELKLFLLTTMINFKLSSKWKNGRDHNYYHILSNPHNLWYNHVTNKHGWSTCWSERKILCLVKKSWAIFKIHNEKLYYGIL